jgi:serine-type D-Ala-D-Ala carboxypeptidase
MSQLRTRPLASRWLFLSLLFPLSALAADDPKADGERLTRIAAVVNRAIDRGQLPGAVVLILHRGEVVYRKAFGKRSIRPAAVPMSADTVFDLASLTKPLATATSVFVLVEQGKLSLSDPVAQHWPDFGKNGKDKITIEQLLLHTGGLPPVNPLTDYAKGREQALQQICRLKPKTAPGERFAYSDIGYIVLGELVARVSGMPLDRFAHKYLFAPLGMKDTTFRPGPELRNRIAPTTQRAEKWLIGEVHDPRAHRLGGVAGHAGLFSTADDLAVFVRMLLAGGTYAGRRGLAPVTVRALTTPCRVPGGLRSPGWDVDTSYSGNRGELFVRGRGFGHTGFTGTSIWVDPDSATAVILLSNRVHPDGKGDVRRLRRQVATLAAAAVGLR